MLQMLDYKHKKGEKEIHYVRMAKLKYKCKIEKY